MRRLLAGVVVATVSGCTCLFDPGQVPRDAGSGIDAGTDAGNDAGSVCPNSPESCPKLPNTDAGCLSTACTYACATGWVDFNGDLADGGQTGCETDCRVPVLPTNPPLVVATVGPPTVLVLTWPEPNPSPPAYRVCTGLDAGTCVDIPGSAVCNAGLCNFGRNGMPNGVRLVSRVISLSSCGNEGVAPAAPLASATPIDSYSVGAGLGQFQLQSTNCDTPSITPGPSLVFTQQRPGFTGQCVSFLRIGDGSWGDATMEFEMKLGTGIVEPDYVSVFHHYSGSGQIVGVTAVSKDAERPLILGYGVDGPNPPQETASSIFEPAPGVWYQVRFIASRGVYSFQMADAGQPVERMRWPSPVPGAATQAGWPGLIIGGNGTLELRNFWLSTASQLPPPGPNSVSFGFDGGLPALSQLRLRGAAGLSYATCPDAGSASGCTDDAGCAPVAGAGCLHIVRPVPILVYARALFDLPVGIDVTQPWSYSLRFMAPDAGATSPIITRTHDGTLLGTATDWNAPLNSAGTSLGVPLETNAWNRIRFRFQPDAGTWQVTLNGSPRPPVARPPAWDRHPGVLELGGGVLESWVFDGYITDVKVSQP